MWLSRCCRAVWIGFTPAASYTIALSRHTLLMVVSEACKHMLSGRRASRGSMSNSMCGWASHPRRHVVAAHALDGCLTGLNTMISQMCRQEQCKEHLVNDQRLPQALFCPIAASHT